MCGIAGFITRDLSVQQAEKVIDTMTSAMAHRGPNDQGCELMSQDGLRIALGHRRLTIIDLSDRGHQPMSDEGGNVILTYNGEIYNYLELKEELKGLNHTFISSTDTEVIIKAYRQWGYECFKRFNGMWALGMYDRHSGRLILSRGRFGQKPLYYTRTAEGIAFASEIKSLLLYPGVECKPNYDKVFRYLAYNYRYIDIDEQSFFDGIYQVPNSSFMVIEPDLECRTTRYWTLNTHAIDENILDDSAVEKYKELFIDAVRLRLRSDVPVGCMLSGGLDSTAITAVAYKVLNSPIKTFSGITGKEKGIYDESDHIRSVICSTEADAYFLKPDPVDIVDTVGEMMGYHDEPICTVTWYSLYLIAKEVAQANIPVILNGHGGDELLAGYWDHYHYHFYDLYQSGRHDEMYQEIDLWQINHHRDPKEVEKSRYFVKRYAQNIESGMGRYNDYSDCFSQDFAECYKRNIRVIEGYQPLLQNRLESELLYETIPASLRPEDRNTMAYSLESRSPFLDYRLVEYCFSLPGKMKIRNGLGKWIHREAMKGILPEDVRTRKDKAGFIAPADVWFRTINRQQIQDIIDSREFRYRGIYNISRVQAVFDEHVNGTKNHQMFLWQLINLEIWFNRYFKAREDQSIRLETKIA